MYFRKYFIVIFFFLCYSDNCKKSASIFEIIKKVVYKLKKGD